MPLGQPTYPVTTSQLVTHIGGPITAAEARIAALEAQVASLTAPPSSPLRPYSAQSPFNTPIEAGASANAQSSAIISQVIADCNSGRFPSTMINEASAGNDFSHPVYIAKSTDPLLTIVVTGFSGGINGMQIRVPSYAVAANGSDGHMCVVQPDGWEYDLWQVSKTSTAVTCTYGFRQRYDGLGIVTPAMRVADSSVGGGTASNFGIPAGLVTAAELNAGVIDHALFVVIKTGTTLTTFGSGTVGPNANGVGGAGASIYPALKGDAASASGTRPPMGARFQLNMTAAAIDATSAPAWEKTIAKALSKYGAYFGDTGGAGFNLHFESATQYIAQGLTNPIGTIASSYGITKDPTFGYGFQFYTGTNKIDYAANMRVINPPVAV